MQWALIKLVYIFLQLKGRKEYTNNKHRSITVGIVSALVMTGCASSTFTKSDKQTSQIITNKNNSYIIVITMVLV